MLLLLQSKIARVICLAMTDVSLLIDGDSYAKMTERRTSRRSDQFDVTQRRIYTLHPLRMTAFELPMFGRSVCRRMGSLFSYQLMFNV
jgi:hypothetical protein